MNLQNERDRILEPVPLQAQVVIAVRAVRRWQRFHGGSDSPDYEGALNCLEEVFGRGAGGLRGEAAESLLRKAYAALRHRHSKNAVSDWESAAYFAVEAGYEYLNNGLRHPDVSRSVSEAVAATLDVPLTSLGAPGVAEVANGFFTDVLNVYRYYGNRGVPNDTNSERARRAAEAIFALPLWEIPPEPRDLVLARIRESREGNKDNEDEETQSPAGRSKIVLTVDIPPEVDPDEFLTESLSPMVESMDELHRAAGGSGLVIRKLDVLEESFAEVKP